MKSHMWCVPNSPSTWEAEAKNQGFEVNLSFVRLCLKTEQSIKDIENLNKIEFHFLKCDYILLQQILSLNS